MNSNGPTVNGTYEDVAAFFRVNVRTVRSWKSEGLIDHFIESRNIMFGMEDVVAMKTDHYVRAKGMQPGEAEARARREWLEHMAVRNNFADLQQRVIRLEEKLSRQFDIAAA